MQHQRYNNRNLYRSENRYMSTNRNNAYNYTSVAHNYEQEYSYPRTINRRVRKIKKESYVKVEKNTKILSLKFIATTLLIATFAIAIVFVEALSIQKRFDIDELNATLKEITENNVNLETELAKNLDLDYVEKVAVSELGMQQPDSHQVVYISVPKESYTEKGAVEEDSFFDKIYTLVNN